MIVEWNNEDATCWTGESGQLNYASHLMIQNANVFGPLFQASIKTWHKDIFNQSEEVLHYTDYSQNLLATSPIKQNTEINVTALSIEPLKKLINLEIITTEQVIRTLVSARLNPLERIPSIMAILHAVLPDQAILFCQPVAILGLAFTTEGLSLLEQEIKEPISLIPFSIPGLELVKRCIHSLEENAASRTSKTRIVILKGLGVLMLGETLEQAFKRLAELAAISFSMIRQIKNPEAEPLSGVSGTQVRTNLSELASLRKEFSISAGHPLIMQSKEMVIGKYSSPAKSETTWFPIQSLASATPWTRAKAMVGLDIVGYIDGYAKLTNDLFPDTYLELEFSPRIILDHPSRMYALGQSATEALLSQELFVRDQQINFVAQSHGSFQALPIFDVLQYEAFCLDEKRFLNVYQQDMRLGRLFQGEIALVTGGASGIGKACVQALLEHGAAVISLDINPIVNNQFDTPEYLGLICDLTNEIEVITAFEKAALVFGGLDMLVLNAGVFPAGCRIESLSLAEWQRVMRINLDSNLIVLREAHPLLKHSPKGGRVLVNASKNVLAPGAGAVAYSSSKAAVTQMARVAALEWGKDRIRVNMIHPDAIFDTGIWTEEVIQARAAHYGMSVQQYKTRNILGVELNSRYVAELIVEMLGPIFEKITGAQIPVDGGSDRVI